MATYQMAPPEKFTFSQPEEWPKWIRRFERFRVASGLKAKSEEAQVNTLVYSMGIEADDILYSFGLTDAQKKEYATVVSSFERYFVKKRSVIYERARFNQRKQLEGESVDTFVTALGSTRIFATLLIMHDRCGNPFTTHPQIHVTSCGRG